MINKILLQKKILNTFYKIFPKQCIVCESESESHICRYCLPFLPYLNSYCKKCGVVINHINNRDSSINLKCNFCLINNFEFNNYIVVFYYKEPIKSLIKNFKYRNSKLYLKVMGNFLIDKILSSYTDKRLPEIIIPIPSHKKKLVEKGFNQSIELSKYLGKKLNISVDLNYLIKIKNTLSQVGLDREERTNNLDKSFCVINKKKYKHIVLVDDVITTGSTIMEIKKVINSINRDAIIDVWCLAKQQI